MESFVCGDVCKIEVAEDHVGIFVSPRYNCTVHHH